MAVFWFGWTKKLKNIFTKKEADALYLQKGQTGLQEVNSLVDFKNNVVCKKNGYVDNVDTNAPTSMINKRYLEEQLTKLQPTLIYRSGTGTSFQDNATIPVNLWSSNYSQWDIDKPIYVAFCRFLSNGTLIDKHTGVLIHAGDERAATQFIGTTIYYQNNNVVSGQYVGIVFKYNQQAQIICRNSNERIGGITLMGYKK